VPFVLISVPIAAVTVWREHAHGNPALPFGVLERVLIASRALWAHVMALLWPIDLTIVYSHWGVAIDGPAAYLALLAWIAVAIALLLLRARYGLGPLIAMGFYLVTLSPMLGFVDYNIMRYAFVADHFQYIASAGLLALAAAACAQVMRDQSVAWRGAAATTLLVVLGVLCGRQAALYRDPDTLWRDNLRKNPRSWIAYTYLATEKMRENRYEEAASVLTDAVTVMPDHVDARRTLGVVLAALGRSEDAIQQLRTAHQLDPRNAQVVHNLGALLLSAGRLDEAATHFASAVQLRPEYAEAWHYWALAELRRGNRRTAIAHLQHALRIRPDYPEARADLDQLLATP
jgi:Tfp pilus assembly protein PilF